MQESIINIIQQISYTNSNISEDISNIVHENKNLKIKTENESKHITSMTIITEKVNNAFYKNNELSIEARAIIDNAIVSLNNGKKNMDLMVENIETINEKSKNIMEISNFINDISFKTNILALNSAIEASRAGVNKGGFSVIAKEIRELSNICQNYATDIKNIVKISQGQILETKSLNEKK